MVRCLAVPGTAELSTATCASMSLFRQSACTKSSDCGEIGPELGHNGVCIVFNDWAVLLQAVVLRAASLSPVRLSPLGACPTLLLLLVWG